MKSGATWVTMLLAADLAAAVTWDPVPAQPVVRRDGLGNVLAKLEAGRPVTIAYFGGSITADLSAWTAYWNGTNFGQGGIATGTVDALGNYSVTWSSTVVGGAFDGMTGVWTMTGTVAAVPEASTYGMMLAGLGLVGFAVRRRKLMA